MKKMVVGAIILAGFGLQPMQAAATDLEAHAGQSRGAVKAFFTELKGELETAMKSGGPLNAIGVCNIKAPKIAAKHSEESGLEIGRTSLKLRNGDNAPDAWEQSVLEKFEQRKAAGEDLAKMEFFEVVEADGNKSFRYMKAIPTGDVCLKCHGADIDPAAAEKLDSLYPDDQARGYNKGDIRGAFTITQPM